MVWSNHIRNFPGLVGVLGSELFRIVHEELKIPGSAFRRRLRNDFMVLDIR
jgi:hypothetical protein